MEVKMENRDTLNAKLRIEISKDDYITEFDKALKSFRNKSSLKGFRKGKAPMGYIRKIYGQSALADAVNDVLQKGLTEHLSKEEIRYIGQPLPAEEQEQMEFDAASPGDYKFTFDLGLVPQIDLKGLDASIQRYDVQVAPEVVDEEWQNNLKRMGSRVEVEDKIEPGDILFVRARELDGGKVKEEGWEASFAIGIDDFADEKLQKKVLKMKAGDSFEFSPSNLEKDRDISFIRKYHLGLEDQPDREISDTFSAEIERVQRMADPIIDQSLFDRMFGEDKVHSVDEAKEEIRKYIKDSLDQQADAVLYRQMQDSLMKANEIELPAEFLDRWLDYNRREDEPVPSDHDRLDFRLDLKWQLIKDKIAEQNSLEVTSEDLEAGAYRRVMQYVGPYGDPNGIRQLVSAVLGNEEQVDRIARETLANKVFGVLKESFKIVDKPISEEEFRDKAKEILEAHRH